MGNYTYRFPFIVMIPTMQAIGSLTSNGSLSDVQSSLRLGAVDIAIRAGDVESFPDALCKRLPLVLRIMLLFRPGVQESIRVKSLERHVDVADGGTKEYP